MSKVSNMLNMLFILNDKKVHNMAELSRRLEVSTRMIKQYKDELELAGIYIDSIRGISGGYILNQELNNIDIGLTLQEIYLLNQLNQNIKEIYDNFELKESLLKIVDKICKSYEKNELKRDENKLSKILKENKGLEKVYLDMRNSINNKKKVYIEYSSINSGVTERIIHPAELFNYLNDWYVAAFCQKKLEIRLFKLKSILKYKVLNEVYEEIDIKK